jgi:hypothetical protein
MTAVATSPGSAQLASVELIAQGLEEARAIPAPEVRADHVAAWILRMARAEPRRARDWVDELDWDAGLRARAFALIALGVLRDVAGSTAEGVPEGQSRGRASAALRDGPEARRKDFDGARLRKVGDTSGEGQCRASAALRQSGDVGRANAGELEEAWREAIAAIPAVPEPDLQLEIFNDLCEAAIGAAERDRELGRGLLGELEPAVETLGAYPEEQNATRALAAALLAEALAALGDPAGSALFARAEQLSRGYAVRDRVLTFAAQSDAGGNRERALAMASEIADPWTRFETRAGLLQREVAAFGVRPSALDPAIENAKARKKEKAKGKGSISHVGPMEPAEIPISLTTSHSSFFRGFASAVSPGQADVLAAIADDAAQLEPMRRSQAFARLGSLVWPVDPDAGRDYYQRAAAEVETESPQLQALQLAAVATSVHTLDEEWAASLFSDAMAAAASEPELVRGVVARISVAFQMGHRDPASAQEVLNAALTDAASLEALWELAHVAEILFDPRGRPELDLSAARPLLEAALARIGDEDPRLPGVLGLADVGHCFAQFDTGVARGVFERWLAAATRTGDADSMLYAASTLHQINERAGTEALRAVARQLVEREDCFGLSQFCLAAVVVEPRLVARVAPLIPDSRERTRSLAAAAAGLWPIHPEGASALIAELPGPDERSAALLTIVDQALGTGELPRPMAESSFSVCCSTIPQLGATSAEALRRVLRVADDRVTR